MEPAEGCFSLVLHELLPQKIAEEVVVAVGPLAGGGEREHAVRGQVRESLGGRTCPPHAPRQVDGEVLEATRAFQERPGLPVFAGVHLLREVRVDVLFEARVGECGLDEIRSVPVEDEACEDDARGPSLGEIDEVPDESWVGASAGPRLEDGDGLLRSEPQHRGVESTHLIVEPQLGEVQCGVVPSDDDEPHAGWEIGEEVVERRGGRLRLRGLVEVVQDDVDVASDQVCLAFADEHGLQEREREWLSV